MSFDGNYSPPLPQRIKLKKKMYPGFKDHICEQRIRVLFAGKLNLKDLVFSVEQVIKKIKTSSVGKPRLYHKTVLLKFVCT